MATPLGLLREFNVNGKEIVERDGRIYFGDLSWPKHIKTNYLEYGSGRDGANRKYYTLESLIYLLKNVRLPHPSYVKQAAAEKIDQVRRPDRRDLLSYLNGETATSASIDRTAPLEVPAQLKRPTDDTAQNVQIKKPRLEKTHEQRFKEQLAAKLEAPKEFSVKVDNIKSLSEAMSVDKIAAIKAKRLAKKRTTIKENDDIGMNDDIVGVFDNDSASDTKAILARERQWRTRTSILRSTGVKDFAKSVRVILESIKIRERNVHGTSAAAVPPSRMPNETPMFAKPAAPMRPSAYNRYDQQRFVKQQQETEGFNINTMQSYAGSMSLHDIMSGKAQSAPIFKAPAAAAPKLTSGLLPVSAAKLTPQQIAQHKRSSKTPIIVIPSSTTTLISMLNAKDILQDFRFVSNEQKLAENTKKDGEFLLQRRKQGGLTVPYRVVENVQKLSKDDWEKVVAVFVMGPSWQFKGWPYNGNPVEIFSKICAFHLKYDEMKLDANVARWAVTVIELSKTKRHLDRASIMRFWEILDKYMVTNKPNLRF